MPADEPDYHSRRDWPRVAALAALTVVGVYLCYLLVAPFLPALAWAVALAVVAFPLHRWVERVVSNRNWAAGVSTTVVVLVIAVPIVLVFAQLAGETTRASMQVREQAAAWREYAARLPYVGNEVARLDTTEVETQTRELLSQLVGRSFGVVGGMVGGFLQALAAVFVLFFCLRDRQHLLAEVRKLLPLAPEVSDRVIGRAEDAVHATVYGTLLTAVLQGVSGGLLFWVVGLPSPVLWGVVMVVLGVLPFVGAFLVWVPAVVYLASHERWGAAVTVVAWGLLMAGPVCNYVYALAAGDRLRIHPVPALLAFIGGLAVFGVSGMILGPCVLAVTVALLAVWRHRTADGIPVAATSDQTPVPVSEANHAPARR